MASPDNGTETVYIPPLSGEWVERILREKDRSTAQNEAIHDYCDRARELLTAGGDRDQSTGALVQLGADPHADGRGKSH